MWPGFLLFPGQAKIAKPGGVLNRHAAAKETHWGEATRFKQATHP